MFSRSMGAEGVAAHVSCWGSETAAFASICLVWISRSIASVACEGVFLANSALIRSLSSFLVALSLEHQKPAIFGRQDFNRYPICVSSVDPASISVNNFRWQAQGLKIHVFTIWSDWSYIE